MSAKRSDSRRHTPRAKHGSSPEVQVASASPAWPAYAGFVLALIAVCAIVAAAHGPVLSAQALTLDDPQYLTENVLVQDPSWDSARRFFAEVTKPSTVRGYYQPLTMISLMLDYAAGGRPDNLRLFHRTNLALHVANTALIILLLYALFGRPLPAVLVGLLFGVHPVTVEPMAWVADRKTTLSTFFALLSLIAYVRFARPSAGRRVAQWRWLGYLPCVVTYVLALLAKPTTIPLPFVFLLLDYWPLRRIGEDWPWRGSGWRSVLRLGLEKLPLFAILAAAAAITVRSQSEAAGVIAPVERGLDRVFWMVCHNIDFSLRVLVWPVGLTWYYPFPEPFNLTHPAILLGVLGTPLLIAVLLVAWRRTRIPLTCGLIFLVAIFPTLGVLGYSKHIMASLKYVYFPAIGPLLLVTALLIWVWSKVGEFRWRRTLHVGLLSAVGLAAGLEIWQTRIYLAEWQETERLHRKILTVHPRAFEIRYSLGVFLGEHGRLDEAVAEYEQVICQRRDHWNAHSGLAKVLQQRGQVDAACAHFNAALALNPNLFSAHYNFGVLLNDQKRCSEAVPHFQEALRIRPDDFRVRTNLGNALASLGRNEEALMQYDEALRLKPRYARGYFNRGVMLASLARYDEAIASFQQALEIDPGYEKARQQLEATQRAVQHPTRP